MDITSTSIGKIMLTVFALAILMVITVVLLPLLFITVEKKTRECCTWRGSGCTHMATTSWDSKPLCENCRNYISCGLKREFNIVFQKEVDK